MGINNDIKPKPMPEERQTDLELEKNKPETSISREVMSEDFFSKEAIQTSEKPKNSFWTSVNTFANNLDKRYLWLLLVPIFIIVILQNYNSIKNSFSAKNNDNATPATEKNTVYEGEIVPQDYTQNSTENANSTVATVETTQSSAPAATTSSEITKSTVSIKLLNGNGINRSAATVKKELENAGFTISKVTNADSFQYTNSTIYYKTGQERAADLVKAALVSHSAATTELSDAKAGSYDIVIIIGKN